MSAVAPLLMVVDDDQSIRDAIQATLRVAGYRVASAPGGMEALALLRSGLEPPAILLLDLMMPQMSGLELLAILRTDDRMAPVRVILITASGEQVGSELPVLRKPFGTEELLVMVRKISRE